MTKSHPKRGRLLEKQKHDIELTSSSILTLNTIANTMGAMWVASIAEEVVPDLVKVIAILLVVGILFGSEILPKNMGVIYRRPLQKFLVFPLELVRISMYPMAYLSMRSIRLMVDPEPSDNGDEEEEEIFPDHYYDGGKIPVFKPVSTEPHTLTLDVILIHSTDHETVSEFQRLCRED